MDIYTKWSPILDALKVTDEKTRKIMAEYADFHTKKEIESQIILPESDVAKNLLPVSMKILARLNLTNKNVILKEGLPSLSFSEKLERGQIQSIKESEGMELVQQLENMIIDEIVNYINKELETKDNLYINLLAQSISFISEKNWAPRMMITSRIHID